MISGWVPDLVRYPGTKYVLGSLASVFCSSRLSGRDYIISVGAPTAASEVECTLDNIFVLDRCFVFLKPQTYLPDSASASIVVTTPGSMNPFTLYGQDIYPGLNQGFVNCHSVDLGGIAFAPGTNLDILVSSGSIVNLIYREIEV